MTWLLACLITIPPIAWLGIAAVALVVFGMAHVRRRRREPDETDASAADRP